MATSRTQLAWPRRLTGVDAIIMTHGGSDGAEEDVDYGAVAVTLAALGDARPRIVLMTSMSVSQSAPGPWSEAMEWKRRGERLLRVSGFPYVIVRPGWFDMELPGEESVVLEQGDVLDVQVQRGVSRQRIADALVSAALADEALATTFEMFGAAGPAPTDWAPLFAALEKDAPGALDGARDVQGPALEDEPARLRDDMARLGAG